MALVLHEATVAAFSRIIGSMLEILDKAECYCVEKGLPPDELLNLRLAPDMHPFNYQVKSIRTHSMGAIEGVRRGSFSPDTTLPPTDFSGLRTLLGETHASIAEVSAIEVEALGVQNVVFTRGSYTAEFSGQEFLLRFSIPNCYFHLTTAYGLLRAYGINIGKRDYLGRFDVG